MGSVCNVFLFDNKTKIIKICEDSENTQTEYDLLQFLQEKGFNTPTLIDKGDNYIIMEYIVDNCDDSEHRTTLLFKELNKLHSIRDKSFGFDKSIFCGKLKVPNDRVDKWSILFKNRWKTMLDHLLSKDVTFYNTYCYAMRVYDVMEELLDRYDVYPSLLHGDINPRNFLIRDNKVYLIDPVCFYGDREYDIACYDIWSNYNKKSITSDKKTLYYAFILLLSYSLVPNEKRMSRAKEYMKRVLASCKKCYPSSIYKINTITDKYKYIIIMCGCFNPVHKNHTDAMILGKNHMQRMMDACDGDILCVFALANDENVFKKESKHNIHMYHRREMLKLALESLHFINVCIDTSCLYYADLIQHYGNIYPAVKDIFICCGTDAIHYPLDKTAYPTKILVIKRNNYKTPKELLYNPRVILVDNPSPITLSSTAMKYDIEKYREYMEDVVYEYYNKLFQ